MSQATENSYDVVVTDFQLPGASGLELIKHLHATQPRLPVILMTAHSSTQTVIEATKFGAHEYVLKGAETTEELIKAIDKAVQRSRQPVDTEVLDAEAYVENDIVGCSPAMIKVYQSIGRLAATPVTVLVRGETGTGKELVSRALHQHSGRGEFIVVNCVAIPETLLESQLFGHEAGAFTGATARQIGKFEEAKGGTIFLDEIGDMSSSTQAKLLRVLEEKTIQRLGGHEDIAVDARVIAATHRDLEKAIAEGGFRDDLYYRLAVAVINLPPLRERPEDIPSLVQFFVKRHGEELGSPNVAVENDAIKFLQAHSWPGNVRELANVVRRALSLALGHTLTERIVREAMEQATVRVAPEQTLRGYIASLLDRAQRGELQNAQAEMIKDLELELYARAIELAKGNQALAARWLGVSRPTMREKLNEYGLHPGVRPEAE